MIVNIFFVIKNKIGLLALVAAAAVLSPAFSSGQNTPVSADKKMQAQPRKDSGFHFVQNEKMDDGYLPNAYNNKKTSPGYKYISPEYKQKGIGAPKVMSSSIYTIQVNVNSNQQNIVGDAANEPNIAVNPVNPNEIVIGWREFDNVLSNFRQAGWAYSSNAGATWTFPGVINPGLFRTDPVLDVDSAGNFYFNSEKDDFSCQVFESTNGGASWGNGTAAGGGDKQWMTIDRTSGVGMGNMYSFWTQGYSTCMPGYFTRSTNGNSSYENCTVIDATGGPQDGTMAVGNAGELYIAGASETSDSIFVSKSLNAEIHASLISWNSVSVYLDGYLGFADNINPVGLLGQTNIDVDRSNGPGRGNVYVLASVGRLSNSDSADVMFSRSTDGGIIWSTPIRVNDDSSTTNTQWFGTMSVAPNGRIDAVWLDNRDAVTGSDSSALYYSYSVNQGATWSANQKMSASFYPHIGYPNQNKMGDYFDMISDNTGAHLAWANTFNGEEDVYYSHIVPQIATGVNEISDNSTISIFPNPTTGMFVITGVAKQSQLAIYNTLGQTVASQTTPNEGRITIDISSQPKGIYFLKIINQDGSAVVKKIIRE